MKRKILHISIIILIVLGICITEQILAQGYFNEINKKVKNLEIVLSSVQELNNDIAYYTDDLKTYWTKKENVLCTFVNHKDINDVGIEIEKMQTAISNNDTNQYYESLSLISFYIRGYQHLVGINLQNIF